MRRVFYLLVLQAPLILANAQDNKKDSLLRLLPAGKNDTATVALLQGIADAYETNNQDSSVYYLEKSRQLSESLKYSKGIYRYYNQYAIVSFTKGDYAKAMEQNKMALAIARQMKDSSAAVSVLNNISVVYAYLGDFESQLDYALQVKDAVESAKDSGKLAAVYHGVSNVYFNLKQYRRSTDFALLAVRLHTEFKKRNEYINRVYATLGQDYENLKKSDSALYYYDMAIEASIKANDKYAEGTIYGYLCDLYASRGQFDQMLKAGEKSLELARRLQSRQMVAYSLYNLASANFYNGRNSDARKMVDEALAISEQDSLRDELKNGYRVLSYIAARDGDFEMAAQARRKADSIEQLVLNEQIISSSSELEKKYESEKKDEQIKLQKAQLDRRRVLDLILLGTAVFSFIIFLLAYRNYRQKQKIHGQRISELEKEQQLLSTEAVLKGEERERSRLAKDLHDGLGGMMSGIKYSLQTVKKNIIMTPENQQAFERSLDMLDSSIDEMRRVAHNMMPEALVRFGLDTALSDLCSDINQMGAILVNYQSIGMKELKIDQTLAITIYRIIQELINNAIKHAAATTAIVQVSNTNGIITITVEDDGKGFDPEILIRRKGIGWSNIQSRVGYLKGKVDLQSAEGKGTSVHIELNV